MSSFAQASIYSLQKRCRLAATRKKYHIFQGQVLYAMLASQMINSK
jgi:hypothetical protein